MTPQNHATVPASMMSPMTPNQRADMDADRTHSPTPPPSQARQFFSKMSPKFKWGRRKRDERASFPQSGANLPSPSMSDEDASMDMSGLSLSQSHTSIGSAGRRRQDVRSAEAIETPPVYTTDMSTTSATRRFAVPTGSSSSTPASPFSPAADTPQNTSVSAGAPRGPDDSPLQHVRSGGRPLRLPRRRA